MCTPMFIAVLFAIARTWQQPRCPSTDEWIKKLCYIYTTEYYSAMERNVFESVLMRQMNLEPIIQSEVSSERDKYHILMHIYGIQKDGTDEPNCRAAVEMQTQRTDLWAWEAEGEKKGGMTEESGMETYTLPYVKQIASGNLLYDSRTQTGAL